MPKLVNLQTGARDLVEDEDLDAAVAGGKYAAPDATAVNRFGADTYVAPDVAKNEQAISPTVSAADVALAQGHAARAADASGVLGGAKALGGGIASGLTLGALNPWANEQEFHGALSLGGNIIGQTLPLLLSGGAAAPEELGADAALAAGRAGEAGSAITAAAEGAPVGLGELASKAASLHPYALAQRAGGAVGTAIGGGIGQIAGAAVEGAGFGAGQGVQESMLSQDPLTAEQIMGNISSNALFGMGIGAGISSVGKLAELGLSKAGGALRTASEARAALSSMPGDLAAMDENGLKAELTKATEQHTRDVADEVQNVKTQQAQQREQLVGQVKDLHEALKTDAPIFMAVGEDANKAVGGELWKIDGMKEAYAKIGGGFGRLSKGLGNTRALAENPKALTGLIDGLQRQELGLEAIQKQLPRLQETLADHPQFARGLPYVGEALDATRDQITKLKTLSQYVSPREIGRVVLDDAGQAAFPEKLLKLTSGESERVTAIKGAQQALKDGKDLGFVGSKVKRAAQTIASGAAHFVPGFGPLLAHSFGETAGNAIEWAARRLKGVAGKTADATSGHLETFLDTAKTAGKAARAPLVAHASEVLSKARFSDEEVPAKGDGLGDLFTARSAELRSQTQYMPDGSVQVRPEKRQQIAAAFDGIRAAAPVLADKLEDIATRKIAFLSSILPRKPDMGDSISFGPDKWKPSDLEIRAFARSVRAVEDPESVEKRLAHGVMTPEEARAYRTVYPARFAGLQQSILQGAPTLSKTLSMQKKIAVSVFTGVNLIPALQPNVLAVLQSTFRTEPGTTGGTQSPMAEPSYGHYGSLKSIDKPSPSQSRADE